MAYKKDDGKSISSFVLGVKRWTRKAQTRCDVLTAEANFEIGSRIILRSPVDTGLFRGNWQGSIGGKARGRLGDFDKTGLEAIARLQAVTKAMKAGDKFYFSNNLPYARALEYGHSKQAPVGMVRVTLSEFHSVVALAAARAKAQVK